MEDINTIVDCLTEKQIKSINDAYSYIWKQYGVLSLLIYFINEIAKNKLDTSGISGKSIQVEGFLIRGETILDFINDIKPMNDLTKSYFHTISKNFFRGATHPVYEIANDPTVKKLISYTCFEDQDHFQKFLDVVTVVRHFLSHNYTEKVVLKNWDIKKDSTISNLLKNNKNGSIVFKYNGAKYFSGYNFEIDISFELSNMKIGQSLFEAITINELFFVGELCNNCLKKVIDIIQERHNYTLNLTKNTLGSAVAPPRASIRRSMLVSSA